MNSSKEKGSIIILTTLLLTVLLGFAGICTDMALIYAEKARLQSAVDSSALAGVQELPNNPGQAVSTAVEYGNINGITVTSTEIKSNNKEILVTSEREVPLHLIRIFGIDSQRITASARAAVLPANTIVGAVPLSITMQDFNYGEEYTLKSGSPEGDHGWFGALRLDGNGARNYREALAYGCDVPISIGQIIDIEHGNMSGPTRQGLETRLASDSRVPRNTFEDHDRNAPQIVYVPVVEEISRSGDSIHSVKVLGFAAFFVENVSGNGNQSFITGRFLRTIVPAGQEQSSLADLLNSEDDLASGDSSDYGLLTSKLL